MTLKFTAIVGFCLALAACGGGGGGDSPGLAGAAPTALASSPADTNNTKTLSFTEMKGEAVPLQASNVESIGGLTASTASSRLPVDPGSLAARAALPVPPPKPQLSTPSTTVTLGGPKGRDEIPQSIFMGLNRDNKWPWTLSAPLPSWVTASPTSGTVDASGTSLSFSPVFNAAAPGTHSGIATVTAQVNGDTATLPLNLVLNRDKRLLLVSEWGIGFASLPSGSVLTRTLKVTDNFGAALPWTATSSASWLSVTSSGTTGSGAGLVLTADPKLAPLGAISYATVTLNSSNPDVASAVVQVGLWRSGSELTTPTSLPAIYTNLVADKIRPYVYAHNSGTSIDIYNAHLGTKVGTIPNVGTVLNEMTVAADGSKLYVLDTSSKTIVVVDLATASKREAWPLKTEKYSPLTLQAIRTNGQDIVLASDGTAYAKGQSIGTFPSSIGNVLFAASSDGRKVFAHGPFSTLHVFDVDYSAMANGILMVKSIAEGQPVFPSGTVVDIAVDAEGTALYTATGAPYLCSSVNPATLAFIDYLPGGAAYPNNVEVTRDGRVICGINGMYGDTDIWLHSPDGRVLKSFRFASYTKNLLDRQLAVTPDGMSAIGLTNDPQISFIPLGAP
ncbi:hypothetical protein NU688_29580 [Variovorax sp. ZS18.2.2]|uniref:BACON domain-containing protein n=1 Tax=Variovorax sp. ZS18.2.2 TaxID=2971255 RepID=UPI002151EFC9|nr:hypothetical protein [Variovorax sp. ZS18.2.2]MCR6480343.1 hypothetical protein [Variovorax sp. ZS18.2.2]